MGRVFGVKAFGRQAKGYEIPDDALLDAIDQADQGNVDVNLGGGVYKLRVARQGGGTSGGYRTIVGVKAGERAYFLHVWAKNEYANINKNYEGMLKGIAAKLLPLTDKQIDAAIAKGEIYEIVRPAPQPKETTENG